MPPQRRNTLCLPLASLECKSVTGDQSPPGLGESFPCVCELVVTHFTFPGGGVGNLQGTTHEARYFRFLDLKCTFSRTTSLTRAHTHSEVPAGFAAVGTDLICELSASSAPVVHLTYPW